MSRKDSVDLKMVMGKNYCLDCGHHTFLTELFWPGAEMSRRLECRVKEHLPQRTSGVLGGSALNAEYANISS